jgi:hypothetical protein
MNADVEIAHKSNLPNLPNDHMQVELFEWYHERIIHITIAAVDMLLFKDALQRAHPRGA